jgi:hypothetical protein
MLVIGVCGADECFERIVNFKRRRAYISHMKHIKHMKNISTRDKLPLEMHHRTVTRLSCQDQPESGLDPHLRV